MTPLPRLHRRILALILALYLLLTGWMVVYLPAFASPNEALHYEVVALLRRLGRLPEPVHGGRDDERHQAPLYYLVAGLAAWPWPNPLLDGDLPGNPHFGSTHIGNLNPKLRAGWSTLPVLYVGRAVTLLFGLVGLLGMVWISAALPSPEARLLAIALWAFHPMTLFLSASLSNDLPVAAMSALLLGYSTLLMMRPRGRGAFALWGLLLAAAVLTKASAIFLLLTLPFVLYAQWRQQGRQQRRTGPILAQAALALVVFGTAWAAWSAYNVARGLDVFGTERSFPLAQLRTLRPGDIGLLLPYLPRYWRSINLDWSVGDRGWGNPAVYWAMAGVLVAGPAGWGMRRRGRPIPWPALGLHAVWIILVIVIYLAVKLLVLRDHGVVITEGRLLSLTFPSIAWLVAGGFPRWWPEKRQAAATWALLALWVGAAAVQTGWLLPALYPRAQLVAGAAQPETSASLRYDDKLALLTAEVTPLHIGKPAAVALTWQVLADLTTDYTISLQLLQPVPAGPWIRLDWQNSYPGLGMSPTAGWRAGEVYTDRVELRPMGELNGPTMAQLVVWVLDGARDGDALPVSQAGQTVESPVARPVIVRPAAPIRPPAGTSFSPVEFGGAIMLRHAEWHGPQATPTLTLYWEATADGTQDYTVFVHWLDAQGNLVGQGDSPPNQGQSPTSIWQKGDGVRDVYRLAAAPAPVTAVRVGLYDPTTQARPAALRQGQRLPDAAVLLERSK